MRDPSVTFPETYTDARGVERVAGYAAPNYTPAPAGLTDRQRANAEARAEQPAQSAPIVPTAQPSRDATAL